MVELKGPITLKRDFGGTYLDYRLSADDVAQIRDLWSKYHVYRVNGEYDVQEITGTTNDDLLIVADTLGAGAIDPMGWAYIAGNDRQRVMAVTRVQGPDSFTYYHELYHATFTGRFYDDDDWVVQHEYDADMYSLSQNPRRETVEYSLARAVEVINSDVEDFVMRVHKARIKLLEDYLARTHVGDA